MKSGDIAYYRIDPLWYGQLLVLGWDPKTEHWRCAVGRNLDDVELFEESELMPDVPLEAPVT